MAQQSYRGSDAKLEMTKWKQKKKALELVYAGLGVVYFPLLLLAWWGDGYVKNADVMYFQGLGEVMYFAVSGGLFVGGFGALIALYSYRHPGKMSMPTEANLAKGLLSEGERIIRGTRVTEGPSPAILKAVAKDSKAVTERIKTPYPLAPTVLAGSPFPYGLECMSFFVIGAAGSGKSQLIKELIHGVRARGGRDRFIIYDRKPEYLPIFWQDGDVVICPADRRHTPWDLFAEVKGEEDIDQVVMSLFPEMPGTSSNEFFWTNGARNTFKAILIYLINKSKKDGRYPSNQDLCRMLAAYLSDPKKLWGLLKTDEASKYFAAGLSAVEGGGQNNVPTGILSTMLTYTSSFTLPEIAEPGWFSIRRWLRDPGTEGQAVFLSNPAIYSSRYKSYYTVILDLALKEMISLPNDLDRRVWIVIDEFGSLFRLDSIVRLIAEGRSKGACTIIGTQDLAQIKLQYKDEAETLLNSCNTKAIARITSKEEAKQFADQIGELETEKGGSNSNINMDDRGVSVSMSDRSGDSRRERRQAVLSSEIQNLEGLTYFAKFCDHDWFRKKITYYPWGTHEVIPAFVKRPADKFDSRKMIQG